MKKLPLTDLILTLREELQQAQEQAKDQKIAFEVQEIELEVAIVAEEDKSARFDAKLVVINLGVKGKQRDVASHRLRLRLKPQLNQIDDDKGPTRVLVNAEGKK